jgi:hypothetical protein
MIDVAPKHDLQVNESEVQASPAPRMPPDTPDKRETPRSKLKTVPRPTMPGEKADHRQKVMMALIPVLAIAMIFLLKRPFGARRPAKPAKKAPKASAPADVASIEIAWQLPAPYELGGRDPMRPVPPPLTATEGQEAEARVTENFVALTVTGILYSNDRPAAIVDTQIVHEGQQVAGAMVEKIDRDGVQFEKNGRRWKQTINQ